MALGFAFITGAEEAWIASEVGEELVRHAYLRGSQINALGTLARIVISVAIASIRLNEVRTAPSIRHGWRRISRPECARR